MTQDSMDYAILIDQAMRGVVRDVLRRAQASGLPGDHHFYVSFLTTYPAVQISDQLKSRSPKGISIVLQHQYWDLKVEEHAFAVTLSFGGLPEKLYVPFAAMTAFADPTVKFGLQFQRAEVPEEALPLPKEPVLAEVHAQNAAVESGAEIISLDAFRKK